MLIKLLTLAHRYLSFEILTRYTVRIHSGIVAGPGARWAKLWYLLRGLDIEGNGFIRIPLGEVCQLLGYSSSTIYEQLRLGESAGAFRFWRVRQGLLSVALASLEKLCLALSLGELGWGTVTQIPLVKIHLLKPLLTGAVTQRLQQLSRFAAWRSLPAAARKTYKLPQPGDFFATPSPDPSSDNLPMGALDIKCVLHISQRKVFCSKGFIPFGVSQNAIAHQRNVCDRTVRRHQEKLGIAKRQILQAKIAYKYVKLAMEWHAPSYSPEPGISAHRLADGGILLTETSGRVGNEYSKPIREDRLFEYGDRYWQYRCNLYEPIFTLCSMSYRAREYRSLLEKSRGRKGERNHQGYKS